MLTPVLLCGSLELDQEAFQESLDNEMEIAAVKIQSLHRGRAVRRQVSERHEQMRRERELAYQNLSATKIQAAWRGRRARKKVNKMKVAMHLARIHGIMVTATRHAPVDVVEKMATGTVKERNRAKLTADLSRIHGVMAKAVDKDPDKAMTLAQGSAKERQKAAKLVKLQDLPLPKPGPSPKPKPPLPAKATPKKAGGVPPLPAKAKAKGGLPPLPGQAKAIPLPPTQ